MHTPRYGEDGAWLWLLGKCFVSEVLSEKRTLGGTSNVDPVDWTFRVCPFDNVTQLKAPLNKKKQPDIAEEEEEEEPVVLGVYRSWVASLVVDDNATESSKSEAATLDDDRGAASPAVSEDDSAGSSGRRENEDPVEKKDAAVSSSETLEEAPSSIASLTELSRAARGEARSLFAYGSRRHETLGRGDARRVQDAAHLHLYDGGAPCVGERPRHVLVDFLCARTNRVVEVHEDGLCAYVVHFETPLACSEPDVHRRRLDAVEAALATARRGRRHLFQGDPQNDDDDDDEAASFAAGLPTKRNDDTIAPTASETSTLRSLLRAALGDVWDRASARAVAALCRS